jgi:hypothetical protein
MGRSLAKKDRGIPEAVSNRRVVIRSFVLLWLALVGAGLLFLWSYENTPGVVAAPSRNWPGASRIKPKAGRATLVIFAHPRCPCSRASIEELDQIMAHCQSQLDAYVVLVKPVGFSDAWVKSDLWLNASQIPGVTVLVDEDGIEAKRFHAATSGQAILYDAAGLLLFSGGITGSRGHVGDNAGESAIESLVNTGTAETSHTSVFGCPMFNPDSECRREGYEKTGN